ncbi:MAG TPA: ABC transporter substrate-binding protein [Ktedonobacteraceae bacterium]|nr:ABC transporter substrate-binding protein [Ktedonobacteraceae bacterium]
MPVFDRQQQKSLDELVEDFSQRHTLTRREFVQRAMAVGLSGSAAAALLAACTGESAGSNSAPTVTNTVDVLNVWTGEEQASFQAVVTPFESQNNIKVSIETTRDLDAVLTSRIRSNNPPGIAVLPNPAKMQQLASQHQLVPLNSMLDMSTITASYASGWINLGTYKGSMYALFYKAANKGTIWYSPKRFHAIGAQVPATWQDLLALSTTLANTGKYPWSMGASSGSTSGWPAADWLAEIYLNQSGPDMYSKWYNHQIPWTDASIKSAFQAFGQIVGGKHYIKGAPLAILATGFQDASYLPFNTPPDAYMYYLGDFTEGFITGQFPHARPGTDFNFFPFPTINARYQNAVTAGADVIVALKNTTAVQKLVQYLATPEAQTIWVRRGGFTATNKNVNLSAYPNPVAANSAKMLASASIFAFGADDLMPPAVENAFWQGMLTFIEDQSMLDSILDQIESTAQQAYTS